MKRGLCILLLTVLPALLLGYAPLAPVSSLDLAPLVSGPPRILADRPWVNNIPGQVWASYEFVLDEPLRPPTTVPVTRQDRRGETASYVQYETLIVIYPHTAAGHLNAVQVKAVKDQVRRARDFYWRNSHLKLYLNLTFLVIEEYVDASEFECPWSCGWLWPNDYDGDGESPGIDLRAHGVAEHEYDSINLFWAHNGDRITACAGGLTWPAGWWWDELGHTAITSNALFAWGNEIWNSFHHEFQHALAGAFAQNGYDLYAHPDQPWAQAGRFGDNWGYQAAVMRNIPPGDWAQLAGEWGRIVDAPDADGDGVPDSGDLPLTEESINSSAALSDTDGDGYTDLQEALAGLFRSSDPLQSDSDGDGVKDGKDSTPLYPMRDRILQRSHTLDGRISGWTLLTQHIEEPFDGFEATTYANWHGGTLYLMFVLNKPALIDIHLDGKGDGFWHGRDNYALEIDPRIEGSGPGIMKWAAVQNCSPRQTDLEKICRFDDEIEYSFERTFDPADIGRFATQSKDNYIVQLAIPADQDTGFRASFGNEIGLRFLYKEIDHHWLSKSWVFAEDDLVYMPLLTLDAVQIEGQVLGVSDCDVDETGITADVQFVGENGSVYEATSSDDGRYSLWVQASNNPYSIIVRAEGFGTSIYKGITFEAARQNEHTAILRLAQPCINVELS